MVFAICIIIFAVEIERICMNFPHWPHFTISATKIIIIIHKIISNLHVYVFVCFRVEVHYREQNNVQSVKSKKGEKSFSSYFCVAFERFQFIGNRVIAVLFGGINEQK